MKLKKQEIMGKRLAYVVEDASLNEVWIEYHDEDFALDSDYTRAPWADQYDGKEIPAKVWIDNGFWCQCEKCYRMVKPDGSEYDEDEGEDEDEFDGSFSFTANGVLCERCTKLAMIDLLYKEN